MDSFILSWHPHTHTHTHTQVGYDMTRMAAEKAYRKAGLAPSDVQVVELHDCFSANELISYEALGLCGEGECLSPSLSLPLPPSPSPSLLSLSFNTQLFTLYNFLVCVCQVRQVRWWIVETTLTEGNTL